MTCCRVLGCLYDGSGAGGSIRVEGENISLGQALVAGGIRNVAGGDGHARAIFRGSVTSGVFGSELDIDGPIATPGPTPTPTAVPTLNPASAVWHTRVYNYGSARPNQVTGTNEMDTYTYDENGNQVTRTVDGVTWNLVYGAENRLVSMAKADESYSESYLYDGDGVRVGRIQPGIATYLFMGGLYEISVEIPSGTVTDSKSYYTAAGEVIAVRDADGLNVMLTDHLGSVVGVVDGSGALVSEQRYLPFGEARTDLTGITATDLSFTGQRALEGTGLLDYHARQYDPALRSFIQADSIIPNPYGVLDYNRYLYVHANPIRYTDPSGNKACIDQTENGNCFVDPDWHPSGLSGFGISYNGKSAETRQNLRTGADLMSLAMMNSPSSQQNTSVGSFFRAIMGKISVRMNGSTSAGCETTYYGNGYSEIVCGSTTDMSVGTIIHENFHVFDKRYQELSIIDDKANPNEFPHNYCENCFASDYLPYSYWHDDRYTLYAFVCPTIQCIAHPPSLQGYDSREAFANIGQVWVLGGTLFKPNPEGTELQDWISFFMPEFIGRMGY